MNCPFCQNAMTEKSSQNIIFDICQTGCQGIWLTGTAAQKLMRSKEAREAIIEDGFLSFEDACSNHNSLQCPFCQIRMITHPFKTAKKVRIKECYGCGGIFLSLRELKNIQENMMNEKQREEYIDQLIKTDPKFTALGARMQERFELNKNVKNISDLLKLIDDP